MFDDVQPELWPKGFLAARYYLAPGKIITAALFCYPTANVDLFCASGLAVHAR